MPVVLSYKLRHLAFPGTIASPPEELHDLIICTSKDDEQGEVVVGYRPCEDQVVAKFSAGDEVPECEEEFAFRAETPLDGRSEDENHYHQQHLRRSVSCSLDRSDQDDDTTPLLAVVRDDAPVTVIGENETSMNETRHIVRQNSWPDSPVYDDLLSSAPITLSRMSVSFTTSAMPKPRATFGEEIGRPSKRQRLSLGTFIYPTAIPQHSLKTIAGSRTGRRKACSALQLNKQFLSIPVSRTTGIGRPRSGSIMSSNSSDRMTSSTIGGMPTNTPLQHLSLAPDIAYYHTGNWRYVLPSLLSQLLGGLITGFAKSTGGLLQLRRLPLIGSMLYDSIAEANCKLSHMYSLEEESSGITEFQSPFESTSRNSVLQSLWLSEMQTLRTYSRLLVLLASILSRIVSKDIFEDSTLAHIRSPDMSMPQELRKILAACREQQDATSPDSSTGLDKQYGPVFGTQDGIDYVLNMAIGPAEQHVQRLECPQPKISVSPTSSTKLRDRLRRKAFQLRIMDQKLDLARDERAELENDLDMQKATTSQLMAQLSGVKATSAKLESSLSMEKAMNTRLTAMGASLRLQLNTVEQERIHLASELQMRNQQFEAHFERMAAGEDALRNSCGEMVRILKDRDRQIEEMSAEMNVIRTKSAEMAADLRTRDSCDQQMDTLKTKIQNLEAQLQAKGDVVAEKDRQLAAHAEILTEKDRQLQAWKDSNRLGEMTLRHRDIHIHHLGGMLATAEYGQTVAEQKLSNLERTTGYEQRSPASLRPVAPEPICSRVPTTPDVTPRAVARPSPRRGAPLRGVCSIMEATSHASRPWPGVS